MTLYLHIGAVVDVLAAKCALLVLHGALEDIMTQSVASGAASATDESRMRFHPGLRAVWCLARTFKVQLVPGVWGHRIQGAAYNITALADEVAKLLCKFRFHM